MTDETYHGIPETSADLCQIRVEETQFGGERETAPVPLRCLVPVLFNLEQRFDWGYRFVGPAATASAILHDALEQKPGEPLQDDFLWDVVSHLRGGQEWYLRNERFSHGLGGGTPKKESPNFLKPSDLSEGTSH